MSKFVKMNVMSNRRMKCALVSINSGQKQLFDTAAVELMQISEPVKVSKKKSVVVEAEVFDSIADAARYLAKDYDVVSVKESHKLIDRLRHNITYACNNNTRPDYYWNV